MINIFYPQDTKSFFSLIIRFFIFYFLFTINDLLTYFHIKIRLLPWEWQFLNRLRH